MRRQREWGADLRRPNLHRISRRVVTCASVVLAALLVTALLLRLRAAADNAGGVPRPRPCTLGTMPTSATPVGEIVAAVVASTYPNTVVQQRFAPPVPTATTTTLCVLRASDGAVLAHFEFPLTGSTPEVTALRIVPDGSAIYLAGAKMARQGPASGRMCAVRPLTGAPLWCDDFDAVPLHIVLAGADVLVSTPRSLTALEATTGKTLWRTGDAPLDFDLLGLHQVGTVVVGVGGDDVAPLDEVCGWNVLGGADAWCTHTYQDVTVSSVDVDGGSDSVTMAMRFADTSGLVEQLNADSGAVIWSLRMPTGGVGRVKDVDGMVYVPTYADCGPYSANTPCRTSVLMLRAATGAAVGRFLVDGRLDDYAVVGTAVVTKTQEPDVIAAVALPGAHQPAAAFAFRPDGFSLGGVSVSEHGAVYSGLSRIGALSLASGVPAWEANDCGSPLAGSAASSVRGGTTIWCHWPLHSRILAVAVQGELAQLQ